MAKKKLNVALIGTKFMGKAHSNAWRKVGMFFDLPFEPVMKVICGRDPEGTKEAAERFGWQEWDTDWEKVVNREDIDIVDVSAPSNAHHPMVLEAAKAGKHIVCEKPLANSVKHAEAMLRAAEKAGVKHLCGFSYRFAPAVATIKKMIQKGDLGEIFHFRGAYQQDWIVDPEFPINWRLQKDIAGLGSLGDIGAHSIDMCQNLIGDISEVVASMRTFIPERPVIEGSATIAAKKLAKGKKKMGKVDVDDATTVLANLEGKKTMATFEATRFAPGRRNYNVFEVYGSKGGIVWNAEDLNVFQYYNSADPDTLQGFRRVNATDPGHPYTEAWWPSAHIIGYEHLFVHEMRDFVTQLNSKKVTYPTFADGLACQRVLEAVVKSAESGKWVKVK
jgi:predicted dehydrogenase